MYDIFKEFMLYTTGVFYTKPLMSQSRESIAPIL